MTRLYPAIIECLGEAQTPQQVEVRRVAKRMRREIYGERPLN